MAAAVTDIDICNLALGKIGARKITSFADNTQSAELCNRFYDTLRQAELRRNGWKFSITRAKLPLYSTVSAANWPNGWDATSQQWLIGNAYAIGDVVSDVTTDNAGRQIPYIYVSLTDPNTGNTPATSPDDWVLATGLAPLFDYDFQYQLPIDFLRLLPTNPKASELPLDWLVEKGLILTDDDAPLQIRYVQDFTNVGKMESMFVMGLACRIAAEIVYDLKQSTGGKSDLIGEYDKYMNEARRINAIEEGPTESEIDSWEAVRL